MTDIHRLTGLTPSFTAEEEAYSHILQRIRSGQYRSGDRLIPEEIATEIGTSRMPVREAFRRLATEGLVDIRPHRGAVVRKLSAATNFGMLLYICLSRPINSFASKALHTTSYSSIIYRPQDLECVLLEC